MDAYEHLIRLAMGEHPEVKVTTNQANACLLLRSDKTGTVTSLDVPDEVLRHPDLVDLHWDISVGDQVRAFKVGPDRIGHIIVKEDSAMSAEALVQELADRIRVEVVEYDQTTQGLSTMSLSQRLNEESRLRQIAAVYHSESLAGPNEQYHIYLRDAIIPSKGGHSALELGCGKGLWTTALCTLYDRLDVVDGSLELLADIARRCTQRASLTTHVALAEEFLLACSSTWQHIYMTFLLEHIEDPVSVLRIAHARLEQDGMLFVAVPNADSVHRVLALRAGLIRSTSELSDKDVLVGHRRVYTRDLLREHLREADFQIVEERPIGLKPLTLKQLEVLPSSVIAALCASGDLVPDNAAYLTAVARP
jgi:2-polyprenyl-3-methyl-5-hydroxy-6-metoxy-1,4-benzoquinol methylase